MKDHNSRSRTLRYLCSRVTLPLVFVKSEVHITRRMWPKPSWPAGPISNPPSHYGRLAAVAAATTNPTHLVVEPAQPNPPPLTTPSLPLLPSFSIWFPSSPAPPPLLPSIIVVPLLCLHHSDEDVAGLVVIAGEDGVEMVAGGELLRWSGAMAMTDLEVGLLLGLVASGGLG
ncbi:hypothetical protein Dimus_032723 [Dionaea muscipula]